MVGRLLRLDTNLLVLIVAGLVDEDIVREQKHKRLKKYFIEDYLLLLACVENRKICLLPNVASECFNLLKQHASPEKEALLEGLRAIILENSVDNYVPNKIVANHQKYCRIGLTDTAIFITAEPELLTDDFELYHASLSSMHPVTYFTHLRVEAGIIGP